jgi:hypothetical protein
VTITATAEGKSGHARIATVAPVTVIQVGPNAANLDVGDTVRLHVTLYSSDGGPPTDSTVTWTSADTTRVVVSSRGLVTARSSGTVAVTARAGIAAGAATINVRARVSSVTITPSDTFSFAYDLVSFVTIARDAAGDTLTQWQEFCPNGCRVVYPVTMQSRDTAVARFVGCCTLQGRSAGVDTIVATADGVSARAILRVSPLAFTTVAVGNYRACALNADSAAYCWGAGHPQRVSLDQRFIDLAVGEFAACGLTRASAPLCFVDTSLTPQGAPPSIHIDVGGGFVCGLTSADAAWCSGAGGSGQLGYGTDTVFSRAAQTVAGGHSFATLSTGGYHACALTTGGAAYCWGDNGSGTLGAGDTTITHSAVPIPVSGGLTFVAISAGTNHSCGIVSSGDAYCWGDNGTGQLGTGDYDPRSSPAVVIGGLHFIAISAGIGHTCGIVDGGAAYCWGAGATLGNGSGASNTPVPVSGGLTFVTMESGSDATCGRTTNGVYCWGYDITGVDGVSLSLTPSKVQGQQ